MTYAIHHVGHAPYPIPTFTDPARSLKKERPVTSKDLRECVILSLIVGLVLTGCAEVNYQRLNDPSRDAWQKPDEVVETLLIAPGSRVADLGAGGGYFTWHLARAVGARGTVYAVDVNPAALDMIFREMVARGTPNVHLVRARPHDPRLPDPVDLVFSCNTYRQMSDRIVYFRSLRSSLKPGGRVAILDFHPRGFFPGLFGDRISKEEVRLEMEAAGYRLVNDYGVVESQHFQVFAKPAD
jgi:arsenite methyltransferase